MTLEDVFVPPVLGVFTNNWYKYIDDHAHKGISIVEASTKNGPAHTPRKRFYVFSKYQEFCLEIKSDPDHIENYENLLKNLKTSLNIRISTAMSATDLIYGHREDQYKCKVYALTGPVTLYKFNWNKSAILRFPVLRPDGAKDVISTALMTSLTGVMDDIVYDGTHFEMTPASQVSDILT